MTWTPTVCQCSHDRNYHGNADAQTGWQARCAAPDCDCDDFLPDWEAPVTVPDVWLIWPATPPMAADA